MLLSCLSLSITTAMPTHNVLIAGYGPFGNHTFNPSAATAEALNGTCVPGFNASRICFHGWNLTVDHIGASRVAWSLEAKMLASMDAIITLGLESSAKGLKVELAGTNVLADSGGNKSIDIGRPLGALAPATIDTARLDIIRALEPIASSVARARQQPLAAATEDAIDSMWSRNAGTYYCNEALYRTAAAIRRLRVAQRRDASALLPFVFVHLPEPALAPVKSVVAPAIAALAKAVLSAH